MTNEELAVVIRSIAPVVREIVTKAISERDVTPRVAAVEARLEALGDVRDKVISLETKAAVPFTLPDTERQDLLERCRKAFSKDDDLSVLAAQVATMDAAAQRLRERVSSLEVKLEWKDSQALEVSASLADLTKDLRETRERIAIAEVRALVPGPAGKDGEKGQDGRDGRDGVDGKPGADGLGFDDLQVVQHDDRSLTVKAVRGDRVKDIGTIRLPVWIHRGVYLHGKAYEVGDVVTWAGSQWSCNEETLTKPGEGNKAWTLIVKRGADGRDGRDAPGLPVMKVG